MIKAVKSKQQSRNRVLLEIKISLDRAMIFAETDSPGFKKLTVNELKKIKRLLRDVQKVDDDRRSSAPKLQRELE